MSEPNESKPPSSNRAASLGWIVAVALVIVAWAGAQALRGSSEKQVIPGWADGLEAGMTEAQATGKPMVVLFTASWCPPCQSLKKNVLTQSEVHEALEAGFVPVQIDLTDQTSKNPNLITAREYGVRGYPTVMAMTPDGEPIGAFNEKRTPAHFINWLDRVSNNGSTALLR